MKGIALRTGKREVRQAQGECGKTGAGCPHLCTAALFGGQSSVVLRARLKDQKQLPVFFRGKKKLSFLLKPRSTQDM